MKKIEYEYVNLLKRIRIEEKICAFDKRFKSRISRMVWQIKEEERLDIRVEECINCYNNKRKHNCYVWEWAQKDFD